MKTVVAWLWLAAALLAGGCIVVIGPLDDPESAADAGEHGDAATAPDTRSDDGCALDSRRADSSTPDGEYPQCPPLPPEPGADCPDDGMWCEYPDGCGGGSSYRCMMGQWAIAVYPCVDAGGQDAGPAPAPEEGGPCSLEGEIHCAAIDLICVAGYWRPCAGCNDICASGTRTCASSEVPQVGAWTCSEREVCVVEQGSDFARGTCASAEGCLASGNLTCDCLETWGERAPCEPGWTCRDSDQGVGNIICLEPDDAG
ncbi:MAG: hypothetical protein JXR83_07885 [Deltaproteobacteria bacterium]|nr:hypothetical protein [Deltaproteobacteria bacterium]